MRGHFKYDINRCVSCKACVAACTLINVGSVPWREVLTDNCLGYPGLPVHNLSTACMHCEDPACMKGCPVNAYSIDSETGSVILAEEKCIGCNYCFWICPFDAPQYDRDLGNIQKCHFCNDRIRKGIEPACVSACPTGALLFSEGQSDGDTNGIIPVTELKPRITFLKPKTISNNSEATFNKGAKKISLFSEWSLLLFTFLTSLLFALTFSSPFTSLATAKTINIGLSLMVLSIPLLHLGHPIKAWNSLQNLRKSPISFEIAALLLFVFLSNVLLLVSARVLSVLTLLSGLILLLAIDNVYSTADRRNVIKFHPGQIFLTGLMLASLFGGEIRALLFIATLKTGLTIWVKLLTIRRNPVNIVFGVGYILFISSGILLIYLGKYFLCAFISVIIAELISRIGYYIDFNPPGLKKEYSKKRIIQ